MKKMDQQMIPYPKEKYHRKAGGKENHNAVLTVQEDCVSKKSKPNSLIIGFMPL